MAQNSPSTKLLIGRKSYLRSIQTALDTNTGFASAKLGNPGIQRLNYSILAERTDNPKLLHIAQSSYIYHNLVQSGLFPADVTFYQQYNERYVDALRELDYLGVFPDMVARYRPMIKHHRFDFALMSYLDQEPDRSAPSDEANCYLPLFQGKRLLLISSYATLLAERATQAKFEQVWGKTGKRWFFPTSVTALEFPYGYPTTAQPQYANSIALLASIKRRMSQVEFDVALIAAGGMAIPIAAYAKSIGKIGIDLGGHLQILFGILGNRWRNRPKWQTRYFNAHWIDMPARFKPQTPYQADDGAYW